MKTEADFNANCALKLIELFNLIGFDSVAGCSA